VTHMPVLRGSQVLSIFLIFWDFAGVPRSLLPRLKEVRPGQHGSGSELFHILTAPPMDRRLKPPPLSLIHHHEPVDR